jgi:hypothetical protein
MTMQQICILLGQLQRMYGDRVGRQSEVMGILQEAETMVDNATAMSFGMPANHIPPSVASAIFRATTVLTHSQVAYDQYQQAKDAFKKSGSMFGELSKAQREAGLAIPYPISPLPSLMGRRLDHIVGPIVRPYSYSPQNTTESGRQSRFSPATAAVAAAAPAPMSTALVVTRVAGGFDSARIRAGALYQFIHADLVARGVSTDRSCESCLYLGRRGQDAAGHNFRVCTSLAQAGALAATKGFSA